MTDNNHLITLPPELMQELANRPGTWLEKFSKAYCAGADQELEACCEWMRQSCQDGFTADLLRSARRPKPPSLKEQALETLRSMKIDPVVINGVNLNGDVMAKYDIIRRALEALPD